MKTPRETLRGEPLRTLRGTLRVPGDKSITHRACLLGGLAHGTTRVLNANRGLDCRASLLAIERLGAEVVRESEEELRIEGVGGAPAEPDQVLDCQNSGTSLRLLAGILSGGAGMAILTGDHSLRARPMDRVIAPLERMGARIWSRGGGRAPLVIRGTRLRGTEYRMPVASAQVKSAILLAGFAASGKTTVVEPVTTRDHTERMLPVFGVPVHVSPAAGGGHEVTVAGGAALNGTRIEVPGDPSAAAFLIVAALIVPDSEVVIERVGMNPGRRGAIDALIEMGGEIELRGLTEDGFEPIATVVARSSELRGIEIGGERIPGLIDELPVLAVAAAFARGTTTVRDASELRVKESDRIELICRGLAATGVQVEEHPDGLAIHGGSTPQPAAVDACGDHRIAMAMAVLGLGASGPIEVRGAERISTSFPGFDEQLGLARVQR